MMGVPALLGYQLFRLHKLVRRGRDPQSRSGRAVTAAFGFLAGALGLGLAAVIALALLVTTIPAEMNVEAERAAIYALTLAHVPLMAIEGLFTALLVLFLQRVQPELLESA